MENKYVEIDDSWLDEIKDNNKAKNKKKFSIINEYFCDDYNVDYTTCFVIYKMILLWRYKRDYNGYREISVSYMAKILDKCTPYEIKKIMKKIDTMKIFDIIKVNGKSNCYKPIKEKLGKYFDLNILK